MSVIEHPGKFPFLMELINSGGNLEIGYIYQMGISAIATDEGGTIWEGEESYESIETLLKDAENGVKIWIEENW